MAVPNRFSPSTRAKSAEVDDNFDAITDDPATLDWGALTQFTPTPTNVTLGNGSIDSYYQRIGKWVLYKGRLIAGSTTDFTGSGSPIYMNLPVAAKGRATVSDYGFGQITNSSSGTNTPAMCVVTTSTQLFFYANTDNTQAVAGGYPTGYFTAGVGNSTGDSVSWTILYEAA